MKSKLISFNITALNNQNKIKDSFFGEIDSLGDLISALIPYIFGISGIILVLMIVFSGFQMLTSAGDPKAMESAQKKLSGAIIGFVIIFTAYWIVQFIGKMLGIESFINIFGN